MAPVADEKRVGVQECVSEFVGTYLLVLTVGCNVLGGAGTWAATSIAAVLMVSIYALGAASGANFNPAVSLALALSNALSWANAAIYMVVQLIAGITAGFTYYGIFGHVFNLAPGKGFGAVEAGAAEVLYTFMLCFVVLNCAVAKKNEGNQFFGLAIGFVIVAGGYAAGGISGGAFNPAVAFGIDVSSAGLGFGWSFAYLAFEFIGAALAAGLFRVVRPEHFSENQQAESTLVAKLVSEFLGTYFLVLTVGLNVLGGSPAAAWSIAASLMCMIYALGNVSGAHFNPAVTLAIVLSGRNKIETTEAGMYMGAQIVGGVAAGLTYMGLMGKAFALGPVGNHSWAAAGAAELLYTFVLCFVVLTVATTKEASKDMFGLAIGFCVVVGGFAVGGVSGGSLNPAVSFGIDTANAVKGGAWWHCLAYTAFEFAGAGLAAGVMRVTHPSEFQKESILSKDVSYGSA